MKPNASFVFFIKQQLLQHEKYYFNTTDPIKNVRGKKWRLDLIGFTKGSKPIIHGMSIAGQRPSTLINIPGITGQRAGDFGFCFVLQGRADQLRITHVAS